MDYGGAYEKSSQAESVAAGLFAELIVISMHVFTVVACHVL